MTRDRPGALALVQAQWAEAAPVASPDGNALAVPGTPHEAHEPPSGGVSPAPDDLAADVAAAREGDHAAFTRLIGLYDERLRVLAFRLLESRQAMDDVLQDAYLAAYRGLRRFRGEADIGTWLYRIVYNECLAASSASHRDRADRRRDPRAVPGRHPGHRRRGRGPRRTLPRARSAFAGAARRRAARASRRPELRGRRRRHGSAGRHRGLARRGRPQPLSRCLSNALIPERGSDDRLPIPPSTQPSGPTATRPTTRTVSRLVSRAA